MFYCCFGHIDDSFCCCYLLHRVNDVIFIVVVNIVMVINKIMSR